MVFPIDQDVDDVIDDPSFWSTFDVVRTTETIMPNGRATTAQTTTAGVRGVVYPDRSRTLQRTGMGEKQVDSITIVTRFELIAGSRTANGGQTFDADVVVWNNAHYVVVAVRDFTQYGRGFVECTADMTEYVVGG